MHPSALTGDEPPVLLGDNVANPIPVTTTLEVVN